MARPLRIEYPNAYYHVINRGNAGEPLYKSIRDREKFLEYLAAVVDRFGIEIHSYCLMTNHYHLLIETPQSNLSAAIQWLNVSYATYFNKKRKRQGHLFQGRFKSILIEADEYLTQVSRYIHLNPVKAKIVEAPQDYIWSSYRYFTGETKPPEWLNLTLLMYFAKQRKTAIKRYRSFVETVNVDTLENPDRQSIGGCILGGLGFVTWVQETFLADRKYCKEIPQLKKLKSLIPKEEIVNKVAETMKCPPEKILVKGYKRNQPREVAIYMTLRHSGISCAELGLYFGGVSGAAISQCSKKCELKLEQDNALHEIVDRIKSTMLNN